MSVIIPLTIIFALAALVLDAANVVLIARFDAYSATRKAEDDAQRRQMEELHEERAAIQKELSALREAVKNLQSDGTRRE